MVALRWLRFGHWPSEHDLDLMLVGGDAAAWAAAVPARVRYALVMVAPLADLPLPRRMWAAAIRAADGLPLDAFVVPVPGGWSLALWSLPPYRVAVAKRIRTDKHFFDGAVPLRPPPLPVPTLSGMLARQMGLSPDLARFTGVPAVSAGFVLFGLPPARPVPRDTGVSLAQDLGTGRCA